jgi:molybdopterin synthase catalytic subunit/molybdopterin converting factor small subunit
VSPVPIQVAVRCFAILRELAADSTTLELGKGSTLADAWDALAARYPGIEPHRPFVRGARNGEYADWQTPLADGDAVAFLPPVSGGMAHTAITNAEIDVAALERAVAGISHGAVVTFAGRARDHADDGREVLELDYEVYPEMAGTVLAVIAAEAEERWPGVGIGVTHRTGLVPLGEVAVAIVTAAPHRSAAYEANRYVIEELKQRLPIWKRERFADGTEWKRPGA